MKAIYKRELKSYFDSMTGYVFIAFVTAFIGIYFLAYNMYNGYPYFSRALGSITIIMLLAVPVLTMKSFAEERKTRTDQMLLTAPVSLTQIVLGKYFAMMTVFAVPMLFSCLCPLIIRANGNAYFLTDYSSILAFYLMSGVFIAIGMFISSLTESQIISAVATFAAMLVLYLWDSLMSFLPTSAVGTVAGLVVIITAFALIVYSATKNWLAAAFVEVLGIVITAVLYVTKKSLFTNGLGSLLSNININNGFENFAYNNIFDVTGLIAYISAIFVFIFLTVQSLSKRRWS